MINMFERQQIAKLLGPYFQRMMFTMLLMIGKKHSARIFHKNAWKTNVKRDKSIVTLSTLVKEFNAAFDNDDGRTRIREEYQAAEQAYIKAIQDDERIRVYPNLSSIATKLPCIPNNFFRFFQLFQKYDHDQKQREKTWDYEREAM